MRHINDNCDINIQAVATCWFVDVAHKLRKHYTSISQICWSDDWPISPITARWSVLIVASQFLLSIVNMTRKSTVYDNSAYASLCLWLDQGHYCITIAKSLPGHNCIIIGCIISHISLWLVLMEFTSGGWVVIVYSLMLHNINNFI